TDPQTGRTRKVNQNRRQGPTDQETSLLKIISAEIDRLRNTLDEMTSPLVIKADSLKPRTTRMDALAKSIDTILTTDYTKPAAGAAGGPGGNNPGGATGGTGTGGTGRPPRGGGTGGGRGTGGGGTANPGATGG